MKREQLALISAPDPVTEDPAPPARSPTLVAPVFVEGTDEWADDMARWCRKMLRQVRGDCSMVVESLPALRDWCEHHSTEWESFCRERLETDPLFLAEIEAGVNLLRKQGVSGKVTQSEAVAALAERTQPQRTHAEAVAERVRDNSGKLRGKTNIDNIKTGADDKPKSGTSKEYLAARIAKKAETEPLAATVLERMKAGEFKSVRAAAREAGVIKPPDIVAQVLRAFRKLSEPVRAKIFELLASEYPEYFK